MKNCKHEKTWVSKHTEAGKEVKLLKCMRCGVILKDSRDEK